MFGEPYNKAAPQKQGLAECEQVYNKVATDVWATRQPISAQ